MLSSILGGGPGGATGGSGKIARERLRLLAEVLPPPVAHGLKRLIMKNNADFDHLLTHPLASALVDPGFGDV